jgi:hypothetical protein
LQAGLQGIGTAPLLQEQRQVEQVAIDAEVDQETNAIGRRELRRGKQRLGSSGAMPRSSWRTSATAASTATASPTRMRGEIQP